MSNKDNNIIPIGEVELQYEANGKLKQGFFTPTMKIELDDETIKNLYDIPCSTNSERIKDKAELVMSAWFNKVTEIELADRLKYKIQSKVKDCVMHVNTNQVKTCIIEFSLEEIN